MVGPDRVEAGGPGDLRCGCRLINRLGQIGYDFKPKFQIALIFLFFEPSESTAPLFPPPGHAGPDGGRIIGISVGMFANVVSLLAYLPEVVNTGKQFFYPKGCPGEGVFCFPGFTKRQTPTEPAWE